MRWLNLLFVLGINAVPFYGAMYLGWSVSTILVLYWVENFMVIAATCVRIVLHRRWTRKCGHWSGARAEVIGGIVSVPGNANAFLTGFLGPSLVFTLAHGIFVFAIVFGMGQNHPGEPMWEFSAVQFRQGAVTIGVLIVLDLLRDLTILRQRSFAALKIYVDRRMARVIILHITLIFGMIAIASTASPLALLAILIGLKTLVELSAAWFGERPHSDDLPPEPPAWGLKFAAALGNAQGKKVEDLKASWHADYRRQQERSLRDEEAMPG